MQINFKSALTDVLVLEGGKVDDPNDPGGRTNRGVTQRVYDAWRRNRKLPVRDVWLITASEVADIYRQQYWLKIQGDSLPDGVDLAVFDGAVNSGPARSVMWLQAALGSVKVDGVLGEATLAAVRAHPDHDALISEICALRMKFLRALKTFARFGKGWTRRVDHVRAAGQAIAMGSVGPSVSYIPGMEAKASADDAKVVPGKAAADALTGAGGATTIITQVADLLTPASDAVPAIGNLVAWLTAAGAVAGVAGLLYARYASVKQREIDEALMTKPVTWVDLAPAEAAA